MILAAKRKKKRIDVFTSYTISPRGMPSVCTARMY